MGFQTPQYKLSTLLGQTGNGTIQLPDFQRGYKWDEERIRALLVTVTLGHPLGVLMLLQTANDHVPFKPKPIAGDQRTALRLSVMPARYTPASPSAISGTVPMVPTGDPG